MSKIHLTDATLSEGIAATTGGYIKNEFLLPILSELDSLGLAAIEAFCPATFEACVSGIFEDPWERLRQIKNALKKTPLQMYFAGQNAFGRRNFPDDAVEYLIRKAADNGVNRFRIVDPLNDTRNLETALRTASLVGAKSIAGVLYTRESGENNEVFLMYAKQLEEMGASAIAIIDPSGSLRPYVAYQLVKALKATLSDKTELLLHTNSCTGLGCLTALKAAEAGVDNIATALSPFAMGSSLPATETLIDTFTDTPYATELSTETLASAVAKATKARDSLVANGYFSNEALLTLPDNSRHLLPGDTIAFFYRSLRDAKLLHRREEVLQEIDRIRGEVGSIPLCSPVAEIVMAQAILNCLSEKRYQIFTKEFKSLVAGEYGRTPSDITPAFRVSVVGTHGSTDYRPADRMEPIIDKCREEVAPYAEQEEDALTLAMLGDAAISFFEARKIQKYNLDATADFQNKVHAI